MVGGRRSDVLSSRVVNSVQCALARLADIWETLGIGDERRLERVEAVQRHTEELLASMISEEEAMQNSVEQGIASQRSEIIALCRELGSEENQTPTELEPGMRLLQQDKALRLRLEGLRALKEGRLQELRALQRRDQQLCEQLCAIPYYVPSGVVPSEMQLGELKLQVQTREQERRSRAQDRADALSQLEQLRREIGEDHPNYSPEQDDEADLSPAGLQALRDQLRELRERRETLLGSRQRLREQVRTLWERLQTPATEKFLARLPAAGGLSGELPLWEMELARLQEMKAAQLEQVILGARRELQLYWDKCRYSAEQRAAFSPFRCTEYTEELLSQHDLEVVQVKMHYERCRTLLEGADRWEASWARFMELENKASNPNRFANRGGALLKEEKERARVQKQLARLEDELRRDAEAWEAETGSGFLLKGQRLQDYVAEHWEQLKRHREREKQHRVLKGETPLKRAAPHSAPGPASKTRKVIAAPTKQIYVLGCHN